MHVRWKSHGREYRGVLCDRSRIEGRKELFLSRICPTIRDCSWTFVTWPEISFLTDPNFLSFYDIEDIKGNLNDDTHYILGETLEKNCFIWDKNFSISLPISTNIFFLFF